MKQYSLAGIVKDVQPGLNVNLVFSNNYDNLSSERNGSSITFYLKDLEMMYSIKNLDKLLLDATNWSFSSVSSIDQHSALEGFQLTSFLLSLVSSQIRLAAKMKQKNLSITHEDNEYINENMEEFVRVNSGGKFIRGALVNIGYNLFSCNKNEYSDALALAYELFQTAILIHDDIIDHAKLRRGQSTIPAHYIENWEKQGISDSKETSDTANALALCAGDVGMYLASQEIVIAYETDPSLVSVLKYFNEVVLKTIKGEIVDVILPFKEKRTCQTTKKINESVFEIYRLKTAWYTVIGPLCSGAILAGCSKDELRTLEAFAEYLGIAFQIKDDILGVFSQSLNLGKDVGSDVAEFKQTLLYSYVKEHEFFYDKLLEFYGNPVNEALLEEVQNIFVKSGALAYVEHELDICFSNAIKILDSIMFINEDNKNILYGFVWYLKFRIK